METTELSPPLDIKQTQKTMKKKVTWNFQTLFSLQLGDRCNLQTSKYL